MATKELLKDYTELDIFNCTICLERFRNPKYLPCLHTFCQPCLNTYILSSNLDKSTPPTSFRCPICRAQVKPPQESSPMEEWADLMPLNHIIFSLMDNSKITKQANENNCNLCERDEEITKAEFRCIECRENLCGTCRKYHKRHKAYINHKVVPISELKLEDNEVADVEEPCVEHKREMMKVFCVDHRKMCCVICLSVNHRKCDNVKTFDEMAENMKEKEEVQQLTKKITDMSSKTQSLLIKKKENIDNIEIQHKDILAETSAIVEEGKRKLDICYEQFKKQFSLVQEKNSSKLVDTKERLENFLKFLSYCETTLKAVTKYGSPKQAFVTLEKIKIRLDLQGKELEEFLKDDQDVSYKLVLDKHVTALKTSMSSIAEVVLQTTGHDKADVLAAEDPSDGINCLQRRLKSADIGKLESVNVWDVNAGGFISSGLFLDNGNLICVNEDKQNISMYDTRGQLLNTHQIDFTPWGICQGSDGSVYVSCYDYFFLKRRVIKVFTITNQSLRKVKQIFIKYDPLAINITEGKMLVQLETIPASIHLMTLDGHNDKEICQCVCYSGIAIGTSSGKSKFYHCEKNAVVCRSLDGKEEFRHKLQLNEPRGVALDAADNIYVCSRDSSNIFVVSKDGSSSRVFMLDIDKISHPNAIGFDKSGTKFFVSCSETYTLAVYSLSLRK